MNQSTEKCNWEKTFTEGDWVLHTWSFRGYLMVKVANRIDGKTFHPLQRNQDRWVKHLHNGGSPLELLAEIGLDGSEQIQPRESTG
ncbi:MAG: hypothetical protein AAGJ08_25455 [Cyanobacteria bacterium P01_H01_bin.35]